MSRIEKGTQRFRPTAVVRRSSQPEGHAEPSSSSLASRSTQTTGTTATHESSSSSSVRPAAATRIVPRASSSVSTSVSTTTPSRISAPSVSSARSYAFGSQPATSRTAQRITTPRAIGVPQRVAPAVDKASSSQPSEMLPPTMSASQPLSSFTPYERFLHAAQADPQHILHTSAPTDPSLIAEMAAEAWQLMSAEARALYGAIPMPSSSAPPAFRSQPRAPKKRTKASISDDEAEYNRQCAQQEAGTPDTDLPPLRVDIGTTTMESIAVANWKSGRASSRTFELERVRARQLKKRREEANSQEDPSSEQIKQSDTPAPSTPRETPATDMPAGETEPHFSENRFAVQTRIVDGKIVLDEQSLFANYRDDEQQEREQRNWEVIDEREGDQFVNSASRSKQRRTQRWSAEETERFFQAISQWGTDFEMITRLFPRRTRREIKAKWTKESRQNPQRLDEAFHRRVAVDLTAYGRAAGVDLSGPPPTITPRQEAKPDVEVVDQETVQ